MIYVANDRISLLVTRFQLSSVFDVVDLRVLGTIALALGAANDIAIAAALCYFLNRLRTGYNKWVFEGFSRFFSKLLF